MYQNYTIVDANKQVQASSYVQQSQQQTHDYRQYHHHQQQQQNSSSTKRAFYRANRPGDLNISSTSQDLNDMCQYTNKTPTYTPTPTTPYQHNVSSPPYQHQQQQQAQQNNIYQNGMTTSYHTVNNGNMTTAYQGQQQNTGYNPSLYSQSPYSKTNQYSKQQSMQHLQSQALKTTQQQLQVPSTPNYSPCYNTSAHMLKNGQQQYFNFDFVQPQQQQRPVGVVQSPQSHMPNSPHQPKPSYMQQKPSSYMTTNQYHHQTMSATSPCNMQHQQNQVFNYNATNSQKLTSSQSVPNSPLILATMPPSQHQQQQIFQFTSSLPQTQSLMTAQQPQPQQHATNTIVHQHDYQMTNEPIGSQQHNKIQRNDMLIVSSKSDAYDDTLMLTDDVNSIDPNSLIASINDNDIDDVLSSTTGNDDVNICCPIIVNANVDDELITNTPTNSLQRYPSKDNLVVQQEMHRESEINEPQQKTSPFRNDYKSVKSPSDTSNNNNNSRYAKYADADGASAQSTVMDSNSNQISQRCFDCGKSFTNKSALAKHRLIHSNERKYTCTICDKSFKRQDHLNGHMLTHQDRKPFQCKVPACEKSYCDSRSLKRHIESQHQEFLASLANGRVEALNYLPPIGKIKANIGPNIQQTIVIDSSNSTGASSSSTQQATIAKLPIVKLATNEPSTDSNNQQQYDPMASTQASSSATVDHVKIESTKKEAFANMSYRNFFTFEEPKSETCKICGKGFKNTHALNGHMRQHGGYTKPKFSAKIQNKKDELGTNTKDHPRQAVMKTNKDNNNNNDDDDDTVESKAASDNYEHFQGIRDNLMEKSKAYSQNSRHMSSTLKNNQINDTDFNVNMQSTEQSNGSMSMHQQHYSLDCLAYKTRDENNNNTNSRNPYSRPSNRYNYSFDQNKSEPNPRDYINMPMSVSQSSSFGNDAHDTTYCGVSDCDAQNPTELLSYLRHSTSGLSVDSTAHVAVHNLAEANFVHGIQNKKIDNKTHKMLTCNSNQFFNPIKSIGNNTLISKQKPKPQPITIPSTISTSFAIYPQMTLLKSPHFNFDSSAKNQYTPPPMLSPFRKGTGLFLNNTNRQYMFTMPFSRQFSLGSFYSSNDTWSNSCTNVNNSTILSMASAAMDACNPNAYKNNGSSGVQTSDQFQTQTSKVSLLRTRISSISSNASSFFADDPNDVHMDASNDEEVIKPFINIGPEFQAKLPKTKLPTTESVNRIMDKDDKLWNADVLDGISDEQVRNYLELCCKSSIISGSSDNLELALHLLSHLNGNVKKAVKCFIDGLCELPVNNPILSYKYTETSIWSANEIKLFEDSIQKHDKNFAEISKEISTKTTKDCIEFYYLWKKAMSDTMKKKWRALKRKRQNDSLMDNDLRTTNKLDDLTNDLSTSLNQDDLPTKHIGHNNNFEIENYSLSSDDLDTDKTCRSNSIHETNQNTSTSKPRFQCRLCNLVFKSKQKLRSHNSMKHNKKTH